MWTTTYFTSNCWQVQKLCFTSWCKSFNCEKFTLFHFRLLPTFHNRNRFSSMDLITSNAMSIQVSNTFNCQHQTNSTSHVQNYHTYVMKSIRVVCITIGKPITRCLLSKYNNEQKRKKVRNCVFVLLPWLLRPSSSTLRPGFKPSLLHLGKRVFSYTSGWFGSSMCCTIYSHSGYFSKSWVFPCAP